MALAVTEVPLTTGEWIDEATPKDTIYLHHTAGGHDPAGVVSWWDRDGGGNRMRVATAYVIGGVSTRNGDASMDGSVVRCFPEEHWAYHLGVRGSAGALDRKSIGIEICNYGWLVKSQQDGRFYNYVNHAVPDDQVVELDQPFRGYRYWHRYTDAQLAAVKTLMKELARRHGIDLKAGLQPALARDGLSLPDGLTVRQQQKWLNDHGFTDHEGKKLKVDGDDGPRTRSARAKVGTSAFEYDDDALAGKPGVWTHTNVRKDKTDCSPQPKLIKMLKSL
ncbi:MAG: N-acetylmuramoyl-L-alanine amidase [Longimicrobiales bacterium]